MASPFPYIRRIELENICGFHKLELDFGDDGESPRMQTVVIGRNGTGKTTLLRAIAVGLAPRKDIAPLLSELNGPWLTRGQEQGTIRVFLGEAKNRPSEIYINEVSYDLIRTGEIHSYHEQIFLCGYGVGRDHSGNGGDPGHSYRVWDSAATLFRYDKGLVGSELVLRRLRDYLGDERFDAVLVGLKRALGLGAEDQIILPQGGGVEISGPDFEGQIPLEAWADGYRLTLSWMIDLYGWALRANAFDEDGDVCGILLIDELEQHLHPAMQKTLLEQLARALPKVQIVATTHSPLVALAARAEQIVALHRDGSHIRQASVPDLTAYSAEDVLVEEALFGTDPYAPMTRRRLDRQQELARIAPADRSPEQLAELRRLAKELDPSQTPSLRDDPVLARLGKIEALLKSEGPDG